MKKEIFICDGRKFADFESVEKYCNDNGFRITNTENLNSVHVITITAKEPIKVHYDWARFGDKISGEYYKENQ